MRTLLILLVSFFVLTGCSKEPNIQGAWYFDYEKTRPSAFPNARYESARLLIADVEPRYGAINVDGDTVVLGGAVCKVQKVNDENGLKCDERGVVAELSLFLEDSRLVVKTHGDAPVTAVFSRTKPDPYAVYGIDPNAKEVVEESVPREKVAEPTPDHVLAKYVGYARTRSFDAFYDPDSVKSEGRYASVKGCRCVKPSHQCSSSPLIARGLNTGIDRYVQYNDANGLGAVVADSGVYADDKAEMKPVPQGSVNEILYMRAFR